MTDEIILEGMQIDLSGNRQVWVGKHDGAVLVQFKNDQKQITRLKLSEEAASALQYLLRDYQPAPDLIKGAMMFMLQASPDTREAIEWRQIVPDRLPIPAQS
jgi:hypothetical protein